MRCYIIITILCVLVKPIMMVVCPAPFLPVGSGCYYITLQSRITWNQAFANCALEIDGYLAEVDSEQEQNDVATLLRAADPNSQYAYWIGGSDMQTEGEYRWMTSGKPVTYTPWAAGEPNSDGGGNEDCLALEANSYLWNDEGCSEVTTVSIPTKGICESDPTK